MFHSSTSIYVTNIQNDDEVLVLLEENGRLHEVEQGYSSSINSQQNNILYDSPDQGQRTCKIPG